MNFKKFMTSLLISFSIIISATNQIFSISFDTIDVNQKIKNSFKNMSYKHSGNYLNDCINAKECLHVFLGGNEWYVAGLVGEEDNQSVILFPCKPYSGVSFSITNSNYINSNIRRYLTDPGNEDNETFKYKYWIKPGRSIELDALLPNYYEYKCFVSHNELSPPIRIRGDMFYLPSGRGLNRYICLGPVDANLIDGIPEVKNEFCFPVSSNADEVYYWLRSCNPNYDTNALWTCGCGYICSAKVNIKFGVAPVCRLILSSIIFVSKANNYPSCLKAQLTLLDKGNTISNGIEGIVKIKNNIATFEQTCEQKLKQGEYIAFLCEYIGIDDQRKQSLLLGENNTCILPNNTLLLNVYVCKDSGNLGPGPQQNMSEYNVRYAKRVKILDCIQEQF